MLFNVKHACVDKHYDVDQSLALEKKHSKSACRQSKKVKNVVTTNQDRVLPRENCGVCHCLTAGLIHQNKKKKHANQLVHSGARRLEQS